MSTRRPVANLAAERARRRTAETIARNLTVEEIEVLNGFDRFHKSARVLDKVEPVDLELIKQGCLMITGGDGKAFIYLTSRGGDVIDALKQVM